MKYLNASFSNFKKLIAAAAILILTFTAVSSKLVGNLAAVDPLLETLVDPLNSHGIDVVGDGINSAPLRGRPRVALLAGVPEVPPPNYASVSWMADFQRGANGFVAGAKTDASVQQVRTQNEFVQEWLQTPQDRRVFISFTARDVKVAYKIKQALEESQYVAFIFINPSRNPSLAGPVYDAQFTGRMFSQSGHYLVVDTRNARRSPEYTLSRGPRDNYSPVAAFAWSSPRSKSRATCPRAIHRHA